MSKKHSLVPFFKALLKVYMTLCF